MLLGRWLLAVLALSPFGSGQVFLPGDLLATDYGATRILRITPAGVVTSVFSGAPLGSPSGSTATRDGAYVIADFNSGSLFRFSPTGQLTVLATGVPSPIRVAADLDGSFVVTDLSGGTLRRVSAAGVVTLIRSGFARPYAVAVDPEGFYLVTEELAGRLVRVSRDGSSATPLATGLGLAHGVAVLPDGDYAVISGNPDFVRRVPRAGGASTLLVASPPLGNPEAVIADDQAGVLVLEDGAPLGNRIVHLDGAGTLTITVPNAAWPTGANPETFARIPTLRAPTSPGTGAGAVYTLDLEIPSDAGLPYLLLVAASVYPGQPLGGADPRRTPLNSDFLFQLSLFAALSPYLPSNFGTLDTNGRASITFDLSSLPPGVLSGAFLHFQAASGNPAAPSGVASFSSLATSLFP